MSFFLAICYILCLLYAIVIIVFTIGFIRTDRSGSDKNEQRTFFSIIIAARNEENNITKCLQSLMQQAYPINKYEIIIADDASEDHTLQRIVEFQKSNPSCRLKIISGDDVHVGKKQTLNKAVANSAADYLVFTDADCIVGVNWLNEMDRILTLRPLDMVAAPVLYTGNSIWCNLLNVEMASLQAISVSAVKMKKPLMCNGANVCVRKSIWLSHYQKMLEEPYPGGDDIFMMFSVMDTDYRRFYYTRSAEACVYTNPSNSWHEFIHQRKRWASKIFVWKRLYIKGLGFLVFSTNVILLLILLMSCWFDSIRPAALNLFLLKAGADFFLTSTALPQFRRNDLMIWILPAFLINLLYVPFISLFSWRSSYQWKGKTYYTFKP